MIKFIHGYPGIYISEEKALVIADLHCGVEYAIYKSGISIPSQIKKLQKTISKLIKLAGARKLIILGDLKHEVPGTSRQEIKEIPEFLKYLSKKVKVLITKGNHDSGIERLVSKNIKVYPASGFKLGKYGFLHGHAWMSRELLDCEYLITAHSHPALEFTSSGFKNVEYCWLKCEIDKKKLKEKFGKIGNPKKSGKVAHIKKIGSSKKVGEAANIKLKQAVVMPVFNSLIGGMAFNREKFRPLGPLLRNNVLKWKTAKVYLLDGTYLGRLDKLGNLS